MTKTRSEPLRPAEESLRAWFPRGARVLAAVSGGTDSMCLLHLLTAWGGEHGFAVTAAHFNHGLRGETADRDQRFVETYCLEHGIDFLTGRGDTRKLAAEQGKSLEEAARILRYEFLRSAAKQAGCRWILTAHHADDNAETMLLNLIRGTGSAGLCGIPARRDGVCRPFLTVTREELAAYAAEHAIPHVEDETNETDEATRNVLRHRVLPILRELNPRAVENMTRTAELLTEENRLLEELTRQTAAAAEQTPGGLRIPCRALAEGPPALTGRAALRLMERVCGCRKDLTEKHAAAVTALASGAGDGQISLPYGMLARRTGGTLFLERQTAAPEETALVPGVPARFGGWTVLLDGEAADGGTCLLVSPAVLTQPLRVTRWRASDSMWLPGARGARSFKRLCVDRGIPPARRDGLPVLRIDGKPAAVPGIGVDAAFAPAESPGVRLLFQQENQDTEE